MKKSMLLLVAACGIAFGVANCSKPASDTPVTEERTGQGREEQGQLRTQAITFVHPGIAWDQADLDFMKSHVNIEPWKTSYQSFAARSTASLSYTMQGPFAEVGREPNVNLSQYQNDMNAARDQALMWYMTGNINYANKAKQILLAWAGTHTTWSGSTSALAASDYGQLGVMGAEIIRYTGGGLTSANITTLENYFRNVVNARLLDEGATPAEGNQGAARLKARIACVIFYNDQAGYTEVINRFKAGTSDCISLARNTLWNASANGAQTAESGRDQPHSLGNIGNFSEVARTAEKQGTDLWAHLGNRLMWASEYWCNYNLGNSVPYTVFGPCSRTFSTIGASGRSNAITWAPCEMQYQAYVGKKGLSAHFTTQYRNQLPNTWQTGIWFYRR